MTMSDVVMPYAKAVHDVATDLENRDVKAAAKALHDEVPLNSWRAVVRGNAEDEYQRFAKAHPEQNLPSLELVNKQFDEELRKLPPQVQKPALELAGGHISSRNDWYEGWNPPVYYKDGNRYFADVYVPGHGRCATYLVDGKPTPDCGFAP
jgi:hypothetical protein